MAIYTWTILLKNRIYMDIVHNVYNIETYSSKPYSSFFKAILPLKNDNIANIF